MEHSITPRDGYLEVKLTAKPTPDAFTEYFNALVSHKYWESGSLVLTDETKLDGSTITVQEVRDITEICGKYSSELGQVRTAILVARDIEYGMIRMWDVFVEGKWDVEARLFRSRDEALAWLLA